MRLLLIKSNDNPFSDFITMNIYIIESILKNDKFVHFKAVF
jgi:hypothetical protein